MSLTDRLRKTIEDLDPINNWARATGDLAASVDFSHDPEFLEKLLPLMKLWGKYFDAEVRGWERLPESGPMLLVGNHSGGALTPDTAALIAGWYENRGKDEPLLGLGMDAAFAVPGLGTIMQKLGLVPASHSNAGRALDAGRALFVYPGGSWDVFRPWSERNKIAFNDRRGFIKLALRHGVPVVPIVGHGGHETLRVLTRGDRLAKLFRMERLRIDVYPIVLQAPWGIGPAFPGLPMPAKINVEILEPLDWSHHGPEAANDAAVLDACYEEITTRMQQQLTAMAEANPTPLRTRLRALIGRN